MINDFDLFRDYIALKLHFTTPHYDIVKFNGKHTQKYSDYAKRWDKKFFEQAAKMLNSENCKGVLVSQFLERNQFKMIDLVDDRKNALVYYKDWKNRVANLENTFKKDLEVIKSKHSSLKNALVIDKHDYPKLFKMVSGKIISPETYTFLSDYYNNIFIKGFEDDLMFNELNMKFQKYRALFGKKYNEIFMNIIKLFA